MFGINLRGGEEENANEDGCGRHHFGEWTELEKFVDTNVTAYAVWGYDFDGEEETILKVKSAKPEYAPGKTIGDFVAVKKNLVRSCEHEGCDETEYDDEVVGYTTIEEIEQIAMTPDELGEQHEAEVLDDEE